MITRPMPGTGRHLFIILLVALTALPFVLAASGADAKSRRHAPAASAEDYYIEFRARNGSPSGHSYLVVGRIDRAGRARQTHHFGFFVPLFSPEYPLALVGANGRIGKSELDSQGDVTNRYRLRVSRGKYEAVLRYVKILRRHKPQFALFSTNCNHFVGKLARHIGLRAPANTVQFPDLYLDEMKRLNGHRKELR